ncbi:CRISPR-associated protein Cas1 [Spirochaeta thermophila DSM 6578]|uniref:CRISPR-associated endonuclease Cas1 n=1 Tax=Winmispira thermophila (strain ATCC 700085 / DSM 6578 / Z-1203) TaxID=869211 RepID=G0GAL1_WINT7|nr:CRISPR-associated endonuclease Cas1 [Spirochaeta thermophila]AEJ60976.1 CRISPR-associated protein Cas1 [Spirochaeta thermophila DSM 6578]
MAVLPHLIVDEYGAFIGKHSERLVVTKDKERLAQVPLIHLEAVLITGNGVGISSDAVHACTERGIPIHFLTRNGTPYASLYSAGLTGTVATRRAQLLAYHNGLGLALVVKIASGKLTNQAAFLKYLAKYRKETDPPTHEALTHAIETITTHRRQLSRILERTPSPGDHLTRLRSDIMGEEGRAANAYWEAIAHILPASLGFPGRVRRGARDPLNSALNYGYAILYGEAERALLLAGLDPYAGFLHADRPGKPAMVLDFVEEFRTPVVDRTIIGLATKGVSFDQEEDGLLARETRLMIAEKILERLETPAPFRGKRHPLRAIIQIQARSIATFFRGERKDYTPYRMRW